MLKFEIAKEMYPIEKDEYRYFGCPYRQKVNKWKKIEELININNGRNDCYISIASYDPKLKLNYIFFDLDGSEAMKDAVQLSLYFDKNDYQPFYVLNSGTGYHILLKIKPENFSKNQYNLFYEKILGDLNLKSFDDHVKGDISRMIRIPDTINIKNNSKCHLLKNESYDILDQPKISLLEEIKDFKENEINIMDNQNKFIDFNFVELHEFPCLENRLKVKEPPHIIRMMYVSVLINQGYSDLEIYKKLKSFRWIDWDPQITTYQIRYIRTNNYAPSTCKSLKKRGLCDRSCDKYV